MDDDDFLDGEEDEFDCMMMRDGSCLAAGSEECEFSCPFRADQRARDRRRSNPGQGRLFEVGARES